MKDDQKDNQLAWNVLAAVLSCLIPGLGQAVVQKRFSVGGIFFIACFFLWFFWLGFLIHIVAVLDALFYTPDDDAPNGPTATA